MERIASQSDQKLQNARLAKIFEKALTHDVGAGRPADGWMTLVSEESQALHGRFREVAIFQTENFRQIIETLFRRDCRLRGVLTAADMSLIRCEIHVPRAAFLNGTFGFFYQSLSFSQLSESLHFGFMQFRSYPFKYVLRSM